MTEQIPPAGTGFPSFCPPSADTEPPEYPPMAAGEEAGAGTLDPVPAPASTCFIVGQILAERHRQIFTFGHTAQADRARNLDHWAAQLDHLGRAIAEGIHCGQDRKIVRRRALKLTAQLAALIERLDADIAEWADHSSEQGE